MHPLLPTAGMAFVSEEHLISNLSFFHWVVAKTHCTHIHLSKIKGV